MFPEHLHTIIGYPKFLYFQIRNIYSQTMLSHAFLIHLPHKSEHSFVHPCFIIQTNFEGHQVVQINLNEVFVF